MSLSSSSQLPPVNLMLASHSCNVMLCAIRHAASQSRDFGSVCPVLYNYQ